MILKLKSRNKTVLVKSMLKIPMTPLCFSKSKNHEKNLLMSSSNLEINMFMYLSNKLNRSINSNQIILSILWSFLPDKKFHVPPILLMENLPPKLKINPIISILFFFANQCFMVINIVVYLKREIK